MYDEREKKKKKIGHNQPQKGRDTGHGHGGKERGGGDRFILENGFDMDLDTAGTIVAEREYHGLTRDEV